MKTSKKGISLIKKYEQFRNHPYLDSVGVATIGWGNTFYEDGTPVKMTDAPISRRRAEVLHSSILSGFERKVSSYVHSGINQNQFDALVSLTYNIGAANFKSSTLLKRVNNNPNDDNIDFQFKRWNKGRINGELKELKGLTRRRNEEAFLYFSPIVINIFKDCENE